MVRVMRNVSQQRKVAHELEQRARAVSVKSRTLLVNKYVVRSTRVKRIYIHPRNRPQAST